MERCWNTKKIAGNGNEKLGGGGEGNITVREMAELTIYLMLLLLLQIDMYVKHMRKQDVFVPSKGVLS